MNDNYLWDRTGEPDAELQQLEELLGTLRYEPRPLEIPAATIITRKRTFIPLAIAAAIALLMIGAGLWIRFANSNQRPVEQANRGPESAAPSVAPNDIMPAPKNSAAISSAPPAQRNSFYGRRKVSRNLIALKPRRPIEPAAPALTAEELEQKEQVLIALRLVSAKLNLAQRKAQGLPQVNSIRNQHKVG
jgi:hypothetical protein